MSNSPSLCEVLLYGPPSGLLHLVEHRCPAYTSHSKPSHNFLKTRTYTFALQTRGPFPVCLLPQSSTYRCTSQDQAPYTPSLCEARFPSGPQVLSWARSSERAFSFSWGRNESDSFQRAPTINDAQTPIAIVQRCRCRKSCASQCTRRSAHSHTESAS